MYTLLNSLQRCADLDCFRLTACTPLDVGEGAVIASLLCGLKGLCDLDVAWNGDLGRHCGRLMAALPYLQRLRCT